MTGFASITREDDRATIAVTMRSVNHRYLDLQLRVPQALAAIESDVRALVGRHVSRGRVEVGLSFQLRQVPGVDVEFNEIFAAALEKALDQARIRGLVTGTLTPGDLLRLPQALTIRERPVEADEAAQNEKYISGPAHEAAKEAADAAYHETMREEMGAARESARDSAREVAEEAGKEAADKAYHETMQKEMEAAHVAAKGKAREASDEAYEQAYDDDRQNEGHEVVGREVI